METLQPLLQVEAFCYLLPPTSRNFLGQFNSHGCHDPQLNLVYALALNEEKVCPVFYKNYPGSVRDVSAFRNIMREMGITTAVVLADKVFYSKGNGNELEALNIPYIMPLRRNSLEYEKTPLLKSGTIGRY